MEVPLENKRNVAIIAHGGAGKTTLARAILFNSARIPLKPTGDAPFDGDPEEQKRKMTIFPSVCRYRWQGHSVNLIDTPGYSNFVPATRISLRAAGGAVVILSAISGVKVQTEKVWEYADENELPRIVFVNKMDMERAGFLRAIDDMEKVLNSKGVPAQLPIGEAGDFKGVIDLITTKAFLYRKDSSGGCEEAELPSGLKKEACALREKLVEEIAGVNDALAEKYLNGETIEEKELKKGLREASLTRRFVPVFCGSSYRNIGVNLLMDGINLYLPSPRDKEAAKGIKGKDPASGGEIKRDVSVDSPFSAFVFKTMIDPFTGKLTFLRIFSGKISSGQTVLNSTRGVKEKIDHIYVTEGDKSLEIKEASTGDIVAISKLKDTHTGDTLSSIENPIIFPPLPRTSATLSYAIAPKTGADEDKVSSSMEKLMEEDPTLEFKRDDGTKEFVLSGTGQVHLEVAVERLKRKYGCEVELKTPRVPYRETIRSIASVQGRYKKQSGGRGQYGDVWIELSPLARGSGFEFMDDIAGGAIPRQYIQAVEKGVKEAMKSGVLAGYPVVDIRVRLYDGSFHTVDSSDMAFKIAASIGFKKGVEQAKPVLLEPIMRMEIIAPEENMGDVIGDINSRRGKVLGVEPKRGAYNIRALVPMAEVITYSSDLKGMTRDRGVFTMEFSTYDDVPPYLSQKIIDSAKTGKEEKEDEGK